VKKHLGEANDPPAKAGQWSQVHAPGFCKREFGSLNFRTRTRASFARAPARGTQTPGGIARHQPIVRCRPDAAAVEPPSASDGGAAAGPSSPMCQSKPGASESRLRVSVMPICSPKHGSGQSDEPAREESTAGTPRHVKPWRVSRWKDHACGRSLRAEIDAPQRSGRRPPKAARRRWTPAYGGTRRRAQRGGRRCRWLGDPSPLLEPLLARGIDVPGATSVAARG